MASLPAFSLGTQNGGIGAGAGQQTAGVIDPLSSLHSSRGFAAPNQLSATPPKTAGGIGGLFDRIEQATQSPLFGLGVGLLSGSPQQGFQNARSLSRDKRFGSEDSVSMERLIKFLRDNPNLAQLSDVELEARLEAAGF